MQSQPQNPEFRNNPQNFLPCIHLEFPIFNVNIAVTSSLTKKPASLSHSFLPFQGTISSWTQSS